MKTEWIALFKADFTSKVFSEGVISTDVLYWIKRYENGKIHTAPSTGNVKPLRNFEFYTSDLTKCNLTYEDDLNPWSCSDITENARDMRGSYCWVNIVDPKGAIKRIRMHGWYAREGWNPSIDDDLYFTALMFFLRDLKKFKSWPNLQELRKDLYKDITEDNGIPQRIFEETERRELSIRQIQRPAILK